MAIQIRCPACDKGFRVRDELEGKSLACTGCNKRFVVRAESEDGDERPIIRAGKAKGKSGGGLVLMLGLVGGLLLVCCGGGGVGGYVLYTNSESKPTERTELDKALTEAANKNIEKGIEDAFKDATKRPKGGDKKIEKDLPKDVGKDVEKLLGKDVEKTGKLEPGKTPPPQATVRPELVPLTSRPGAFYVPRGRKNFVLMRFGEVKGPEVRYKLTDQSLAGLGKEGAPQAVLDKLQPLTKKAPEPMDRFVPLLRGALGLQDHGRWHDSIVKHAVSEKEDFPEPRLERVGANGKSLGGAGLKSVGLDVRDVSPDGSLAALGRFGGGYAIVSLIDGKVLATDWRPTVERTMPAGYKQNMRDRGFRFLAPNRWLIVYEDDAMEIFSTDNGTDWQRNILKGPLPLKKEPTFRASLAGWGLSNDGKTLAYWTGEGFDLIDTTTGAVRKTATMTPEGNETNLNPLQVLFSPDDSQVLANMAVGITKKVGKRTMYSGAYYLTRWDVKGDSPPVRLPIKGLHRGYSWWGNKHVLQNGTRSVGISGIVHDAATGKALAELKHKGQPLRDADSDGKLRFLTREFQDVDEGFLFQADFPTALLDELQKRGASGGLPVLQASKDGLGILP